MGYIIEISFDIIKHSNVSEMESQIIGYAIDLNCESHYCFYEMEKGKRNHQIVSVIFNENEIFNCAKFIKTIKKMKGLYHIECIYEDDMNCKLIYASKYYLKNIDKEKVVVYNKFKRERSYSDNETIILSPFKIQNEST
jgi:hypothetical protein